MKVAISVCNQRISPVFDTTTKLLVVTFKNGKTTDRTICDLKKIDFFERLHRLQQLDIRILICGAISKPMENAIQSKRVQVISHVCGYVEEVLQAFLTGQITQSRFLMPGCVGKGGRRFRRGRP
ncbi:MAG: hypothetical protein C4527_11680 [Candidatus Omnitrophota bacterium]|jgi:predicted Fe-Mo cluster-binding NifX family protein|nr:MAG: hypothetical protein C4527_11680 [Candidatus Omnitrophota bacterium]